jgi:hypothetical protein
MFSNKPTKLISRQDCINYDASHHDTSLSVAYLWLNIMHCRFMLKCNRQMPQLGIVKRCPIYTNCINSTGFWVRISARTPILRNITTGGDITGGFFPGAGFPSCHMSIYRVSEDNFRGSACVSEWMLISVKDGELVLHNLRLHKDNKLE